MNDSKEHIIVVASKLFLQKSYKEVTMKELVKATGLSKGAFYHYFDSKEQLFMEVLGYFFTSVMVHAYENYPTESFYKFFHYYAEEVKALCKIYINKFKGEESESEFNMNYFTLAFDALKLFPEFREEMIGAQEKELKIWIDVVKKARETGEIESLMSDEEIAKLFIYSGDGVAMHMIMEGHKLVEMVPPFLNLWDKLYETIRT
jgi:TetR/AcrR family transcriptional regulator, transcriptional repressor for nem operon